MAEHNDLGKKGEILAAKWLTDKGFTILHQNWRHSHYEMDIIAAEGISLHFIEVKCRRGINLFGYPEDSVGRKKMENLMNAGTAFLRRFPVWNQVQYDILSININNEGIPEFFFIEDVYWW